MIEFKQNINMFADGTTYQIIDMFDILYNYLNTFKLNLNYRVHTNCTVLMVIGLRVSLNLLVIWNGCGLNIEISW